jgi:HD-GYP domain-containing protein (c-di-GMP phosphodiesterase class II)
LIVQLNLPGGENVKCEWRLSGEYSGADALAGFFESFSAAYKNIEQSLLMLELDSSDEKLIFELIQSVSVIQSSLHEIGFEELEQLTISIVDLLIEIQNKQLQFETVISDILLLAIDDIRTIMEKIIDGSERCVLLDRMPKVCESISQITRVDESHLHSATKDALLLLDPSIEIIETAISPKASFESQAPDEEELAAYGVEENEDFIFFRGVSEPLETRAHYWRGRSQRMLRLALKMNDHAGRPVDPNQLAAAVYMHDVGMALLPLDIINSEGQLSEEDLLQVKEHPKVSYELLRYMKQWSVAAQMVLQHHERSDGSGYPYQLKDVEICEGAKILAIIDAIDARTHERVHSRMLKRPLLRAAMEISKNADMQFSSQWVAVFREVFQQMRKQKMESSNP